MPSRSKRHRERREREGIVLHRVEDLREAVDSEVIASLGSRPIHLADTPEYKSQTVWGQLLLDRITSTIANGDLEGNIRATREAWNEGMSIEITTNADIEGIHQWTEIIVHRPSRERIG